MVDDADKRICSQETCLDDQLEFAKNASHRNRWRIPLGNKLPIGLL
ncbi:hypothetical protein GRAN_4334 [Granulicella sibirica]|uniref:Uncharacterized protein n=1 Tax=Granulicella sibirica TaxID=2479048 RepID=A0A4Q0SZ01_9BACT|nr:hypothetical protein GRAN_4334 [Granulicella sibirica]